jgi:ubiquinol-cytochrome c reductase cytochrome b subunit/cytochrome b6
MSDDKVGEHQEPGLLGWFKSRVPIDASGLHSSLNEPVPNHLKKWWFCVGGTPAYLFCVQALTGILLTFYYVPEPSQAYESVAHITNDVPFGWWIRGIHKWGANFMIVAVVLHAFRVYFTKAYQKPRELTWVTGAIILGLTMVFGFTGYSLVYEQLSYWGATVAANLTSAAPLVGDMLAQFIRGGDEIGPNTLTRFFVFHIGVLPTLTVGLLVVHLGLVRMHGVTRLRFSNRPPGEPENFNFFPDHLLTEIAIGLVLITVLSCFAVIFPAGLGAQADPFTTPAHIKPEWYFYFTFRWLKLAGLGTAVLSLGFAAFLFVFWPFVDRLIERVAKRNLATPIGIVAVAAILVLTVWEALAH